MKVLHQIRDALAASLATAVPGLELLKIPRQGDLPAAAIGEVLLTYPWGAPNLSAVLTRGVRWIHVLGTGVDGFPFAVLTDQVLTCSRGGSAVPIAEWVMAMMLAFEKRLPESWIRQRPAEGWSRAQLGSLSGKTLGLIGFGAIGRAVAARALPFGMTVRACRRSAAPSPIAGVEIVASVAALVAASDHIVIAAPATAATRHLFNAALFAAMKPGAHIMNVARGALVDQDALRAALDRELVAMASLDAVDPEPLPDGHWMYTHPRVRLSPHISWSMPGAAERLLEPFIENLRRYEAGQPLLGVIDVEERY